MIEIREVKTKRQIKDFIEFPLKLYKGNPYYAPTLYMDEKSIFKKNYAYYEQAEAVYYLAYDGKKIVGRISGILQRAANEKWKQKRVRFTRFDAIDSQEVANALLHQVEEWAKSKGMTEVVGPLGFSDFEREGLLIEKGFDQLSTYEEQYNYPYYQKLIENYGYEKEVDWTEYRLFAPDKDKYERIVSLSDAALKRYGLHLGKAKNTRDFIKKYGDDFFHIAEVTYSDIYGTVPFTEKIKKMYLKAFKLIININEVEVVLDENNRAVCFGLAFPAIAQALQKSGGRLTLPAIIKTLRAIKHPKSLDLGVIGSLPEYRLKGISSVLIAKVAKLLYEGKIEYAETNLMLESNHSIHNQWKTFHSIEHKRRRAYLKRIAPKADGEEEHAMYSAVSPADAEKPEKD